MRVLVTGGAGFIGSHLTDRLLARSDEVLVIDNYATGRRDNLPESAPGLTVIEGDIADHATVTDAFERFGPEVVVHAAASYKDPEDWASDAATNVLGTAHVARASMAGDVRRLIYLQTALCYGLHPLEQPITLDHPILPTASSYAISKTAGEHYVALSGLDWQSFRLANAYGPRNLSGPLPTFYSRLTTGKPCFVMDTRRDFVFVSDLIDLLVQSIDGAGGRGAYHVSSGADYSIEELFEATVGALGITLDEPVEVRPRGADDAFTILLDPGRTAADFGWQTTVPLADGVGAAIEYYRTFGITDTYTHLKLEQLRA
ncbi:MAG TPA: NAD-dependent epimerase/dehydratase family protein [Candidatus Limnocylindria bacterium]|jgi:UDP-glucose 4-epimerase